MSYIDLHWHSAATRAARETDARVVGLQEEVGLTEVKPCRCKENEPKSGRQGPKSLMWFVLEQQLASRTLWLKERLEDGSNVKSAEVCIESRQPDCLLCIGKRGNCLQFALGCKNHDFHTVE